MRYLSALLVSAVAFGADMTLCVCDVSKPETLQPIECALCRIAETQPPKPGVFLVKDSSPTKPNRWLALPRSHGVAGDPLSRMPAPQRLQLWTAAVEKARSLWGDNWGLAINGIKSRTQCHFHIHIGKLLPGNEDDRFVWADGPADIPVPDDLSGAWVHPVNGKLHVHLGQPSPEHVLLR